MPHRFPIAQFPNRPLIAAILTEALARGAEGVPERALLVVSRLALLVWAGEEVVSGANWFRRLLGVSGGAYSLIALRQLAAPAAGGVAEAQKR